MNTQSKSQSESINLAIAGYRECGFGLIEHFFLPKEIAPLVAEAERLWLAQKEAGAENLRFGIRIDQSGQAVLNALDPVRDISKTFAALNQHPGLVAIAETALGGPVNVMKEKLIYKWPGTAGFGPHRDQSYTTPKSGVPGNEVITISIAIDPAPSAAGPTEFFPALTHHETAAALDEPRDLNEADLLNIESRMPETMPGDVILFDGQIPHRSGWNVSNASRRVYMISYVPARYPTAREKYYAGRIKEQGQMRENLVQDSIYFE